MRLFEMRHCRRVWPAYACGQNCFSRRYCLTPPAQSSKSRLGSRRPRWGRIRSNAACCDIPRRRLAGSRTRADPIPWTHGWIRCSALAHLPRHPLVRLGCKHIFKNSLLVRLGCKNAWRTDLCRTLPPLPPPSAAGMRTSREPGFVFRGFSSADSFSAEEHFACELRCFFPHAEYRGPVLVALKMMMFEVLPAFRIFCCGFVVWVGAFR